VTTVSERTLRTMSSRRADCFGVFFRKWRSKRKKVGSLDRLRECLTGGLTEKELTMRERDRGLHLAGSGLVRVGDRIRSGHCREDQLSGLGTESHKGSGHKWGREKGNG